MKKVLALAALLVLFAAPAMAESILGSKHDLSGASGLLQEQLCVFCHTPHAGSATAPLWNRGSADLSAATEYTSDSLDAIIDMTVGDAKLCMTCHDGVMTDNLTNYMSASFSPADVVDIPGTSSALLGNDFSNDHPVGFTYNAALVTADGGGLNAEASVERLLFNVTAGSDGEVWCSSCHDVHSPGTAATYDSPFLRTSNQGSALCLVCHFK